ncbi:unnamed protein product [Schistosoma margrebowiei]|uniref:Uncharacterized protein n=1 Tax=Schistosoma margrebowiei TaxID=48269 RepID=A0A183NC86_9TREM|nr:unnamed protein product [Schistosoma margrebowiei]
MFLNYHTYNHQRQGYINHISSCSSCSSSYPTSSCLPHHFSECSIPDTISTSSSSSLCVSPDSSVLDNE